MKKLFFAIIGFSLLLGFKPISHAQESPRDQDTHYCDPGTGIGRYNLYKSAYCNVTRTDDEDIYEIVGEQFGIEDEDLIEKILNLETINPEALPQPLRGNFGFELTQAVRAAYEKEKILHHMQQGLKQEFEASEVWYNASMTDAPIDLIVDLNLIEIMLFGSQAQWNNDVYRFPRDADEEGEEEDSSDESADKDNDESPESPADSSPGTPPPTSEPPSFNPDQDCVPPDSPDAEPPSPGEIPPLCGNNVLDTGEQCDDGNNRSGDGCGNACQLEDIGSLLCRDPEVVTFRDFEPSSAPSVIPSSAEGSSTNSNAPEPPPSCPPGTRPRATGQLPLADRPAPLPQSPHYPGPFVGGVLKNIEPGEPPACPPGSSAYTLFNAGGEAAELSAGDSSKTSLSVAGHSVDLIRCLPTEFCADFDIARDFLFGAGWKEDENRRQAAESIEVIFCAEVKTANRPESPYSLNEGCIDCHIRAMVDEMEKLLQHNIAPLENTRNAFAISNRWGPNFSFDLNTSLRSKVKFSDLAKIPSAVEQANKKAAKLRQQWANQLDPGNDIARPTVNREGNATDLLQEYNAFTETKDKTYFEALKNYRFNTDGDQEGQMAGRLDSLFLQWSESFSRLQDVYTGLAEVVEFREKNQCSF